MAVSKVKDSVKAVAVFQLRLDDSGKPVTKNKTISNISVNATNQDIYSVVETISSLQSLNLVGIESREYNTLVNA